MYAGTGHSNTKDFMKYILFGFGSLRDTLCRFAKDKPKINHHLTIQLSIIITGLLIPNFACNVLECFHDDGPTSTCQTQNALCGTHSDI